MRQAAEIRKVPSHYQAYLLRFRRLDDERTARWHASLHDERTGERFGFPGLAEVFAHLQQSIAGNTSPPGDRDGRSEQVG